MKIYSKIPLALLAGGCLLVSQALAQPDDWQGRSRGEPGARMQEHFRSADTNGDGLVTYQEFVEAGKKRCEERMEQRFKRIDANEDGSVDQKEIEDAISERMEKRGRGRGYGRGWGK